jgi:pimeloyl-ACP methyl ester carboxylesterase
MRRVFLILLVTVTCAWPVAAATVDGVEIHSVVSGAGPNTVVFVHGWTCDSTSWNGQVPALSRTYRVVTVDLPGHGQSGMPADGKFSIDLFARAVDAVRAEVGADKIVLVGHSMGAPVIRQYARLYPQRVAGLVAVDGPLDLRQFGAPGGAIPSMTGADGLKNREAMIRSMFTPQTPAALQQQILAMMLHAPEATAAGAMEAMFDPALRRDDVTTVPALAVYAGTNHPPDAETMKKVLPRYEAAQIAGTGHFLMMEKPDEFNRLLTAFLARLTF